MPPLLEVDNLHVQFPVRQGMVHAVSGVSLTVHNGETLGLVGESGCGKSTLARSIVQLVPPTAGEIHFDGQTLQGLAPATLRKLRPRLQMIFQDPYASLNPRKTVFDALAEPLRVHAIVPRPEIPAEVGKLMDQVGLARHFSRKFPHEFSGGQRQRIAIARALALRPQMLIADEPVSALDISVQAQILNLLAQLAREKGLAMLLISHDLSVVKHMSNRIAVMYLGRIVELGPATSVMQTPRHPYTQALLRAVPRLTPTTTAEETFLGGDPPSPLHPPAGCPFHPRCPIAMEDCRAESPALLSIGNEHEVACPRWEKSPADGFRH